MAERSGAFKAGSILWALLIGGLVIIVGGSILLPSTKRSRLTPERLRQMAEERMREQAAAEAAAATAPSTSPTTEPSTETSKEPSTERSTSGAVRGQPSELP